MKPVEVMKTPIGPKDFAAAALRSFRALTGSLPNASTIAILWAQYAIETGAGPYCWNHNLFNHKCSQSMALAGVPFMMLANTFEFEGGRKVIYQPPDPATWFRAYDSFGQAMTEHLQALKTGRYAAAWDPMLAGDSDAYCARLREHGYYTGALVDYQRGVRARMAMWSKLPAYEDALAELVASSEAPTMPVLPDSPPDTDPEDEPPIVHPDVPLDPPPPYEPPEE